MEYKTQFKMTYHVRDLKQSNNYLLEDDMLEYFDEGDLKEKLLGIFFILDDNQNGHITVFSKDDIELTENELSEISEYISDQISDGLGEGFIQQDFSEYCVSEDEYCTNEFSTWDAEDYKFQLTGKNNYMYDNYNRLHLVEKFKTAQRRGMSDIIVANFSNDLTHITGRQLGEKVWADIRNLINPNIKNYIVFDNIQYIGSSFIGGFLSELLSKYTPDEVKNIIRFVGFEKELKEYLNYMKL